MRLPQKEEGSHQSLRVHSSVHFTAFACTPNDSHFFRSIKMFPTNTNTKYCHCLKQYLSILMKYIYMRLTKQPKGCTNLERATLPHLMHLGLFCPRWLCFGVGASMAVIKRWGVVLPPFIVAELAIILTGSPPILLLLLGTGDEAAMTKILFYFLH